MTTQILNIFADFFNWFRLIDYNIRVSIGLGLFLCSVFFLIWSIRKKDDVNPIAWGWFTMCLVAMALSVAFVAI